MSVFNKILKGEIKGTILHEDERCAAIVDIQPQGPKHFLVFPKKEIESMATATANDRDLLGHLLWVAAEVARHQGLAEKGYRLVINTNQHGGQSVPHLHIHVIGGRQMEWPPG